MSSPPPNSSTDDLMEKVTINARGNHLLANAETGCQAISMAKWQEKNFLLPIITVSHRTQKCRCSASGADVESFFLHGKGLMRRDGMDGELLGVLVAKLMLGLAVPEGFQMAVLRSEAQEDGSQEGGGGESAEKKKE